MKKQLFTFVMMIALVIVAGSAFGQGTKTTPYKGGTYSYALGGIVVNTNGYAKITYNGADATIKNVEGDGDDYVADTEIPIASGSTFELNFDITYGATAGNGTITVLVTADGCTNQITLAIVPAVAPTIDLTVAPLSSVAFCQKAEGVDNNEAASVDQTNSLTFTVSQSIGNAPADYTWGYTIDLPNPGLTGYTVTKGGSAVSFPLVVSGISKTTTSEVYTVTFTTTTGEDPMDIEATLTAVSLTENSGGANYLETVTNNNTGKVTVKSMPSIGSFDID